MRFLFVALLVLLAAAPAWAAEPWVLQSGPEAVESIPLESVQLVPAWRGLYVKGTDRVWVYATRSPHFSPVPGARPLSGTPWTVVLFYPQGWTADQKTAWLELWTAGFRSLSTLPEPGWPVLFPAVLTKP